MSMFINNFSPGANQYGNQLGGQQFTTQALGEESGYYPQPMAQGQPTQSLFQLMEAADANRDGGLDQSELFNVSASLQSNLYNLLSMGQQIPGVGNFINNIMNLLDATELVGNNFQTFAGYDGVVTHQEILGVAQSDGNVYDISQFDLFPYYSNGMGPGFGGQGGYDPYGMGGYGGGQYGGYDPYGMGGYGGGQYGGYDPYGMGGYGGGQYGGYDPYGMGGYGGGQYGGYGGSGNSYNPYSGYGGYGGSGNSYDPYGGYGGYGGGYGQFDNGINANTMANVVFQADTDGDGSISRNELTNYYEGRRNQIFDLFMQSMLTGGQPSPQVFQAFQELQTINRVLSDGTFDLLANADSADGKIDHQDLYQAMMAAFDGQFGTITYYDLAVLAQRGGGGTDPDPTAELPIDVDIARDVYYAARGDNNELTLDELNDYIDGLKDDIAAAEEDNEDTADLKLLLKTANSMKSVFDELALSHGSTSSIDSTDLRRAAVAGDETDSTISQDDIDALRDKLPSFPVELDHALEVLGDHTSIDVDALDARIEELENALEDLIDDDADQDEIDDARAVLNAARLLKQESDKFDVNGDGVIRASEIIDVAANAGEDDLITAEDIADPAEPEIPDSVKRYHATSGLEDALAYFDLNDDDELTQEQLEEYITHLEDLDADGELSSSQQKRLDALRFVNEYFSEIAQLQGNPDAITVDEITEAAAATTSSFTLDIDDIEAIRTEHPTLPVDADVAHDVIRLADVRGDGDGITTIEELEDYITYLEGRSGSTNEERLRVARTILDADNDNAIFNAIAGQDGAAGITWEGSNGEIDTADTDGDGDIDTDDIDTLTGNTGGGGDPVRFPTYTDISGIDSEEELNNFLTELADLDSQNLQHSDSVDYATSLIDHFANGDGKLNMGELTTTIGDLTNLISALDNFIANPDDPDRLDEATAARTQAENLKAMAQFLKTNYNTIKAAGNAGNDGLIEIDDITALNTNGDGRFNNSDLPQPTYNDLPAFVTQALLDIDDREGHIDNFEEVLERATAGNHDLSTANGRNALKAEIQAQINELNELISLRSSDQAKADEAKATLNNLKSAIDFIGQHYTTLENAIDPSANTLIMEDIEAIAGSDHILNASDINQHYPAPATLQTILDDPNADRNNNDRLTRTELENYLLYLDDEIAYYQGNGNQAKVNEFTELKNAVNVLITNFDVVKEVHDDPGTDNDISVNDLNDLENLDGKEGISELDFAMARAGVRRPSSDTKALNAVFASGNNNMTRSQLNARILNFQSAIDDLEDQIRQAQGDPYGGQGIRYLEEEIQKFEAAKQIAEAVYSNFDAIAGLSGEGHKFSRSDLVEVLSNTSIPEDVRALIAKHLGAGD